MGRRYEVKLGGVVIHREGGDVFVPWDALWAGTSWTRPEARAARPELPRYISLSTRQMRVVPGLQLRRVRQSWRAGEYRPQWRVGLEPYPRTVGVVGLGLLLLCFGVMPVSVILHEGLATVWADPVWQKMAPVLGLFFGPLMGLGVLLVGVGGVRRVMQMLGHRRGDALVRVYADAEGLTAEQRDGWKRRYAWEGLTAIERGGVSFR